MRPVNHHKRAMQYAERLVKLMDTQFRIPGTGIRFGIDPLLGLVPGIGDMAGFAAGALLVVLLAHAGASGFLLARMIFNIFIDAVIGSIPVVGDLFDFAYKANRRNLKLVKEYAQKGKHRGSAWKLLLPLLLLLFTALAALGYGSFLLIRWLAAAAGY
ncbi:DUF4112 domain-containing protein [Sediminibacterium soli]|uniref:DUF4112 domain-containing protein n=1 Tax=Sediminibacterium soli TaxID=2698829 RepID=UPI00137A728E|nr:DUF4112 domain-containing protein [Sediminibacterium soli]NCI45182.1 DUF4112 domain-containing protein [Sediminibacterium soli]